MATPPHKKTSMFLPLFAALFLAHLGVTGVLFSSVLPQAKRAASTGIAGTLLAVLVFPVYLLDSFGASRDFRGSTFEFLYVMCWLFSSFFWALLATAIFRYFRSKR